MASVITQMSGNLSKVERPSFGENGHVVVSNLSRGSNESGTAGFVGFKYVGSGREVYRFGERTYGVSEGQYLLVPPGVRGDVKIGSEGTALGLCLYVPDSILGTSVGLDAPVLLPAACSRVGRMLSATLLRLRRRPPDAHQLARRLLTTAANDLEPLIEDTVAMLDGLDSLRPATRYEMLRRLNVARAYLHAVLDRPVTLDELARQAGMSRFHLLRNFRQCFGDPPAAYHRKLRIEAALAEIGANGIGSAEAALRYGFADSSSFSHACRRAFGQSPMRRAAAGRPAGAARGARGRKIH